MEIILIIIGVIIIGGAGAVGMLTLTALAFTGVCKFPYIGVPILIAFLVVVFLVDPVWHERFMIAYFSASAIFGVYFLITTTTQKR